MNKNLKKYIKKDFRLDDNRPINKLRHLFYEYSKYEINNYEDFKMSYIAFYNFLVDNFDFIRWKWGSYISQDDLLDFIDRIKNYLKLHINTSKSIANQENFANIVKEVAPCKNDCHVLDVGPGDIPHSSISLGLKYPKVTAMDRYFSLSNECLRNLNVNAVNEFFTLDTCIDDVDMVVGRYPCSAIDLIVYLCNKAKKPYFIQTCDCEMHDLDTFYKIWHIDKTAPKKEVVKSESNMGGIYFSECDCSNVQSFGWEDMLPELDPNIKFYKDYAYNVGASSQDVESLIKSATIEKCVEEEKKGGSTTISFSKCDNSSWIKSEDELID